MVWQLLLCKFAIFNFPISLNSCVISNMYNEWSIRSFWGVSRNFLNPHFSIYNLNFSRLCKEQDTFGFDLNAGESWVYPTNYPIREYQFNITQKALHQNTMVNAWVICSCQCTYVFNFAGLGSLQVCLPTGLGKTFIAAVVMYNFYRWYPLGKIIFMAPTKPLVTQQMDACYNIMAIPENVTAEITGKTITNQSVKCY